MCGLLFKQDYHPVIPVLVTGIHTGGGTANPMVPLCCEFSGMDPRHKAWDDGGGCGARQPHPELVEGRGWRTSGLSLALRQAQDEGEVIPPWQRKDLRPANLPARERTAGRKARRGE